MTAMSDSKAPPYPIYKIVIGRAILAAFVALVFDWVGPPLLTCLCIGALLLSGIDRLRKRPDVRAGLVKATIYGIGAVAAFGLLTSHRADDMATANQVIQSLEQYRQHHGAYPETLNELAPELLAKIPRTRNSPFVYSRSGVKEYHLSYVDIPPGGSRTYASKTQTWENRAD